MLVHLKTMKHFLFYVFVNGSTIKWLRYISECISCILKYIEKNPICPEILITMLFCTQLWSAKLQVERLKYICFENLPTVELCSTEFEFWFRASKYLKPSDQQNSLNSCFPAWVKEGGDSGNNDNDLQFMKYPVVVLKPRETPCIPAYCIITANCSAFTLLHFLWRFSLWQLNRHPKSKVWIKGMDWKLF